MSDSIVFVIDDDASFLTAITRLLRGLDFQVNPYNSAKQFLNELSSAQRGCVVVDLQMPGLTGLELQKALAAAENPLPVIFLTGQADIPSTVQAMRGGAEDFLTKRAGKEELVAAIRRAFARDQLDREKRTRLAELRARFAALTERELQVLRHVVQGKMNKQIAAELGINERTVKLHRTSITRKLRAPSVAELTRLAQEVGLA
jgi:two-component system, LuxR family, response regulator FixJ